MNIEKSEKTIQILELVGRLALYLLIFAGIVMILTMAAGLNIELPDWSEPILHWISILIIPYIIIVAAIEFIIAYKKSKSNN